MSNHLIHENSPYLLQHAENPVNWFPWKEEALHLARTMNKPIFLSIGYAACHWCHVMAHESFEDEKTAAFMNEHFINIKVDREEHPELDNFYMSAVVALSGQGGWPLNVFLTPELRPFFGGTYFPPEPRHQLPAFLNILSAVSDAWMNRRSEIEQDANAIFETISAASQSDSAASEISFQETLDRSVEFLSRYYDAKNGGWGRAPKFPQPMLLDFLITQAFRGATTVEPMLYHTLDQMQAGGMYDLVGGGFHRYSTDALWLVPHFEKMLYDNAQLARSYLHAFLLSGNSLYAQTCTETLDFILRELTGPEGRFYASLDADTQGVEGLTYTWTKGEIFSQLQNKDLQNQFEDLFIQPDDDDPNQVFVLRLKQQPTQEKTSRPAAVARILKRLHQYRSQRPQPAVDNKTITAWHALTLCSFAEAARYLQREDYLSAAQNGARFLLSRLFDGENLFRSYNNGYAQIDAFLEDYAASALALLSLYQADFNPEWFLQAQILLDRMLELFFDPQQGFFDTRANRPDLLTRVVQIDDNATPSGSALAVYTLLIAANLSDQPEYTQIASKCLADAQFKINPYPAGFGYWLQALDFFQGPVQQVAAIWPEDQIIAGNLKRLLNSAYHPRQISAASQAKSAEISPLFTARPAINNQPTAYICRHFTCQRPLTDLEAIQTVMVQFGARIQAASD
ncbi:MAG TPA: thioredoxin domain-containing protein [Bellilinea sp.]|jgi:uncharacterized protein YyaL (SSP411 family)|nr:thioredoxin domain-containing protein [Bellilinea sp.]